MKFTDVSTAHLTVDVIIQVNIDQLGGSMTQNEFHVFDSATDDGFHSFIWLRAVDYEPLVRQLESPNPLLTVQLSLYVGSSRALNNRDVLCQQ